MHKQLRIVEQLGYYVACMRENSGGVMGLKFVLQSSEHDPAYCQGKILEFIDDFYHRTFTEEIYYKYREGVLARKQAGFAGPIEEADDLYMRMISFRSSAEPYSWNRLEKEIEGIKNLDYGACR